MANPTLKGTQDVLELLENAITITPFGFLGVMNKGLKGTKTIPFSSISAIQIKKPGFTTGYIQFSIIGGIESRSGVMDAVKDENTVVFNGDANYQLAEKMKRFIEAKILDLKKPASTNVPQKSLSDELEKLVSLKNSGGLSEEEFLAAKAKLINS